jgi:hypothetical protein
MEQGGVPVSQSPMMWFLQSISDETLRNEQVSSVVRWRPQNLEKKILLNFLLTKLKTFPGIKLFKIIFQGKGLFHGSRGSVVVKELCYKQESLGFETRSGK